MRNMSEWVKERTTEKSYELLKGAIDIHVHAGPHLKSSPRSVDPVQAAIQARDAGMRAIVYMDVFEMTTGTAWIGSRVVPDFKVFGGIIMNTVYGGMNPRSVKTAIFYGSGARYVSFGAHSTKYQASKEGRVVHGKFSPLKDLYPRFVEEELSRCIEIPLEGKPGPVDEVDCKTVWTPKVRWKDNINHPETVIETVEMMKKDAAYQIASASGQWWCDLFNQGWFAAEEAIQVIQKCRVIEERLSGMDRTEFGEIALVVSERSQNFQAQKDGLIDATREMFRNWHLSRIGAPFEQLLLSDLARPGLPDYKLYIMADLHYLSAGERDLIKNKIARNGATLLWVYAPGFLSDNSASIANMQDVTGMSFGLQQVKDELDVRITRFDHPLTVGLDERATYGTGVDRDLYLRPPKIQYLPDTRVSPAFYVDDPSAVILGIAKSSAKPGLALKDMGNWHSIYSAAPVFSWLPKEGIEPSFPEGTRF